MPGHAIEEVEDPHAAADSVSSVDKEKNESENAETPPELEKAVTQRDGPGVEPLGYTRSRQSQPERCNSRTTIPFGLTAGLGEENFDTAGDVEKQELRNARNAETGKDVDPNLVDWNGPDDPGHPMNWPRWKKWSATVAMGLLTVVVTFASSVFSTATVVTAKEFHVSQEVMQLGTALMLCGYSLGPTIWGPLSEVVGRKLPCLIGVIIFALFTIPVAVAQNVQTIFVCRFFVGVFGCAPVSVVGGALNDFFGPVERGVAMTAFASATFIGPVIGPVIGGFVTESYLGWRWTQWLTIIMAFFLLAIYLVVVPESFGPVLLQRRAKKIRHATKNWAIHSKADEAEINFKEIAVKYLLKPSIMMLREPILFLMTIYLSLIYGIIYLFFEALPISFAEQRGWSLGVSSLPFISLLIGVLCGCALTIWLTVTRFARKLREDGHVVPEERLIPMIIGGALMPAGMFWFAWTSSPHITPWPQIIALAPVGAGIIMIFLQILNYLIDCYLWQANSAIAGNTMVRSLVAAGFTLFATGMFHNLGVPWATSLLAFLLVATFPVPVLFYFYGAKIRKLSKFSVA